MEKLKIALSNIIKIFPEMWKETKSIFFAVKNNQTMKNQQTWIKVIFVFFAFCFKINQKLLKLADFFTEKLNKLLIALRAQKAGLKGIYKESKDALLLFFNFVLAFYKKNKKRAIIYFILLYITYKLVSGCFTIFSRLFAGKPANNLIVATRIVKPEIVNKEIICYGFLESENNLAYQSEVRGTIEKIFVKEKQYVKKGELIMTIDSKFTADAYTSAKSIYESKKMKFLATKKLYQDELESFGNLKAMEADLENAKSNLESARKAYNGLKIYAPFDGYIDNINKKEGSQVNVGDKLFTLERTDAMQSKCSIQNVSTSELNVGDEVKIYSSGNEIAKGKIAVVGDSIDVYSGSRSILINNIIDNNNLDAVETRPGMSIMIKMNAKSPKEVYQVSSEALEITPTGSFMVKVIDTENDNKIGTKNVSTYMEKDGLNYVYGLEDGDYVVERGHEFVGVGEKNIKYKIVAGENKCGFVCRMTSQVNGIVSFFKDLPEFYRFSKNEISNVITTTKNYIENVVKIFKKN